MQLPSISLFFLDCCDRVSVKKFRGSSTNIESELVFERNEDGDEYEAGDYTFEYK